MARGGTEFAGSSRFTLRRRLGAGGMGEVYEAYDEELQHTVALKTLLRVEPAAIYRFKREFRALAEVTHPNLVSLYELIGEGDSWFFTMELVEGAGFLEYVREDGHGGPGAATLRSQTPTAWASPEGGADTAVRPDTDEVPREAGAVPLSPSRLPRLRAALRQLACGVQALHQLGRLHRDLKPSNVLVTSEGRVVILDFGLISETARQAEDASLVVAGTPAYMSPEQGSGQELTEASDWYSVGVMLYEALTGQPPFKGSFGRMVVDKLHSEPLAPSASVPGLPADLDALCRDLLRRDPHRRPGGLAVLERLGATTAESRAAALASAVARQGPFVGREKPLSVLNEAFAATRGGRTVSAFVHGVSGIGKTALVRHFTDELHQHGSAVVLAGRCFERESVPYKALDGVVDSLSRYLLSLSATRAQALMPRNASTLARLFPVLGQVEAIIDAPHQELPVADPQEARRRAFGSLTELLSNIADRLPVVLHIDDLQWADADSLALLEGLLGSSERTALLLVASFRREEVDSKPFLRSLLAGIDGDRRREVVVDSLTAEEARELARELLRSDDLANADELVESVVHEAEGSPFFVEQLSRHALTRQEAGGGTALAEMLAARIALLPEGSREMLETLAVAGRPLDARVLHGAARLEGDDRPLLAALRTAQLVRASGTARQVELYHDRLRETFASLLSPEASRRIHLSLARTLESRGVDDPEALSEHYLAAGDRGRGGAYAARAATKAAAALAFDRAAFLYRKALEMSESRSDQLDLKRSLGEALGNAGRTAEAGRVYLEATVEAPRDERLELQRRAAQQLLIGGHIDAGLEVIRTVLAAVGKKLPPTPRRALLSILLQRAWLKLRGLRFAERQEREVPSRDLLRIDIYWAASVGLALVDIIRATDFQCRHLRLALRAGEPYRVARALAVEAGLSSSAGGRGRRRTHSFSAKATELSQRVGHPHAIGLSTLTAGIGAFCVGEWRRGAALVERAEGILRDQCTGVVWELTNARSFLLGCFMFLGEVREVSRRLPGLLAAARERGNLYASTELRTRTNIVWLAADDPDGARREVAEALREWSHRGFHRQHYNALLAVTQISLYTGDGAAAWEALSARWPALVSSLLLRIQILRIEATHLRARGALAAAAGAADPEAWLRVAERLAGRIERERMPWSDPLAVLVRAAVASGRHDARGARALLERAVAGFVRAEMGLYGAAARRQLGVTLNDAGGAALVSDADAWMAEQGIRRPARMAGMLAPGFRPAP
jgi:eukaryotic-like serine/threonine-protein kinase